MCKVCFVHRKDSLLRLEFFKRLNWEGEKGSASI